MNYQVNGAIIACQSTDLAGLLVELGYQDAKVATAVNQQFVPAARRAQHALQQGDQIEILAPMQGG